MQVQANGYLGDAVSAQGAPSQLVTNPTQFNEERNTITRAPELGEHTGDVLRSVGLDDEAIIQLKIDNAILSWTTANPASRSFPRVSPVPTTPA